MLAVARNLKATIVGSLRLRLWQRAVKRLDSSTEVPRQPFKNLLIIASDPAAVVGSRGDDAMLSTVVGQARAINPDGRIGVVCVSPDVSPIVHILGIIPEPVWNGDGYDDYLRVLDRYDTVVMIGADVMDGVYGEHNAVRFWAMSDLAARKGLRSFVLGCSFSDAIAPQVKAAVRRLSPLLTVNARDRLSKEKFDAVSSLSAELVADSAFLLPPTPTAPDQDNVAAWVKSQHDAGRFVCAFNTHPMIFEENPLPQVAALNDRLAVIIPRLVEKHAVSFLLVPHDFRGPEQGDIVSLEPLYKLLEPQLADRLHIARSAARASELKALVACADMLVTGRMHLGVGALSMGVPIWGLSPQDKFAGLFEHFGQGDMRITPTMATDPALLESFLDEALSNWVSARDQVRSALPRVKQLSSRNFGILTA